MPNYTPNLQNLLKLTQKICDDKHEALSCIRFFSESLKFSEKLRRVFTGVGINWEAVCSNLDQEFPNVLPDLFKDPRASTEWAEILVHATQSSNDLKDGFLDIEHIVHAIISYSDSIVAWMEFANIPRLKLVEKMQSIMTFDKMAEETEKEDESEEESKKLPPTITRFCTNISAEIILNGNQIFGREKEISSILNTLVRAKKNNVLLIGENGVGRRSICRGIAEKILSGKCSEFLHNRIVYQLDITKFTAGASLYGALEGRAEALSRELDQEKDAILIIPNIHSSVGAGNKEGSMDVANLIKPILNNTNVPVVGITTQADYKKYLEKDSSLIGSFEILKIEEPSKEEIRKILINSLERLQDYHLVNVEIPVIDEILNLCERYIPYKKFPEKAFDVLDHLCASVKNQAYTHPKEISDIEEQIVKKLSFNIKKGSKEDRAIQKLSERYAKKLEKWGKEITTHSPIISVKDLFAVFSDKYKVTENQLKQTQSSLVSDLADKIKEEIHGQNEAVDLICDTMLCTKVGLRDTSKPLAKFLFVGNTGCGKTMTAKKLAKYYFSDEKAILKLDMSEFQEKYTISSLVGSAAGYIGYESGGRLTEFVKHNPSCVVLFDEIEKAHPDVANLLLQIMDEGYLTDSQGYRVDFTNTIIVLTGNIGSGEQKKSMGFLNQKEEGESYVKALKHHFRPEFLARLDEVIVFKEISDPTMKQILWDSLNKTISNLKNEKIDLTIDESAVEFLFGEAKKQDNHARNIQAIVRKNLEIPIAKLVLKKKPKEIMAKINNKALELS